LSNVPALREIVLSLNWPAHALEKVRAELDSKQHLVNLSAALPVIQNGGVLEPLHPHERHCANPETPREIENMYHFALLANVIFWLHNIHSPKPPSAQLAFIQKQRSDLQTYWAGTVASILGPSSKALFVECLRRGFQPSAMEISWREHPEFWGELGALIPVEELPIWPLDGRQAIFELLPLSRDESFRTAATRALFNDPDASFRDCVRSRIAQGKLPRVIAEDLYPNLSSPAELAITRALWDELKVQRLPDSLRNLDPEKFVNMAGLDEVVRRQIAAVLDEREPSNTTILDFGIKSLDFVLNTLRSPDRKYLYLLHKVATRVRRSFKIQ